MPPASPTSFGVVAASGLVLIGLIAQDIGAAIAVTLFPQVGAVGMVTLRLVFSALVLMVIFRPSTRGRSRDDWLTVIGFGLVLGLMNVLFYLAIDRIPLGTAVTIEVLGPLILSVVTGRRASGWLWAALAFAGVLLLGRGGWDSLDPIGVGFAVAAGATWAGYILLAARTSRRWERLDGLAVAMTVGALAALPFGIGISGAVLLRPEVLLLGLGVALLSSAIPYGLELLALRRLSAATFSLLMALSPAIAAAAGFVILGQQLTPWEGIGIALVVVASMGAVRSAMRPDAALPPAPPPD